MSKHQHWMGAACLALGVTAWIGCSSDSVTFDDDDGGSSSSSSSSSSGTGTPASYVGAAGVVIDEVAIYQGPKRLLAAGGIVAEPEVPLVAGRDALLRVFYTATPEAAGTAAVLRLEIGEEVIDTEITLAEASDEAQLGSTANVSIPGALIGQTLSYRVSILQDGSSDNPAAHHPVEGQEQHAVEGPQNTFRVMLVPFQYNADGSGRLPDLSPEIVEAYRQRFLQLYPVSNVEVQVREPVPWNQTIANNGAGWQEVGQQLFAIRNSEKPSDDWYYYAIFQPTPSVQSFCSQGCLLGVTLLNNQPASTGDEQLRLALGVGYPEVGKDTAAHELGHSHGREHAPCGPGLDPSSIDSFYPHAGGGIGVWSYDIVGQQLINPNSGWTDIMGYCDQQWISDHNYEALLNRGAAVNMPKIDTGGERSFSLIAFDGVDASWGQELQRTAFAGEGNVDVEVLRGGEIEVVRAHYYKYDHLPGGWLFVPDQGERLDAARFRIDGVEHQLSR